MFPYDFFSQHDNAELALLIVSSPMPDDEKEDWLKTLTLMNAEEKVELCKNLIAQIQHVDELEKVSMDMLMKKIAQLGNA